MASPPQALPPSTGPIPPERWRLVSRAAIEGRTHAELWQTMFTADPLESTADGYPSALGKLDGTLPPLSQDEALDLLDKFLHLEAGGHRPGVALWPLHWEFLAAHYYPHRDPVKALAQLVSAGALVAGGRVAFSDLGWPITTQGTLVAALSKRQLARRFPTFTRLERRLSDLRAGFPTLLGLLLAFLLGGVFVKVIDWLLALVFPE